MKLFIKEFLVKLLLDDFLGEFIEDSEVESGGFFGGIPEGIRRVISNGILRGTAAGIHDQIPGGIS